MDSAWKIVGRHGEIELLTTISTKDGEWQYQAHVWNPMGMFGPRGPWRWELSKTDPRVQHIACGWGPDSEAARIAAETAVEMLPAIVQIGRPGSRHLISAR